MPLGWMAGRYAIRGWLDLVFSLQAAFARNFVRVRELRVPYLDHYFDKMEIVGRTN